MMSVKSSLAMRTKAAVTERASRCSCSVIDQSAVAWRRGTNYSVFLPYVQWLKANSLAHPLARPLARRFHLISPFIKSATTAQIADDVTAPGSTPEVAGEGDAVLSGRWLTLLCVTEINPSDGAD